MPKVELKKHRLSTAKKFYEMLNNPNFKHFSSRPPSLEAERNWLKSVPEKSKKNIEHNYAIYYDGELAGGAGIKIDQHRKHIGEIGYFVDEKHWNKGIATKAVKLLEKIGFSKLGIVRMEIRTDPRNKASERVAIKAGYKKEGRIRKGHMVKGKYCDTLIYGKVK